MEGQVVNSNRLGDCEVCGSKTAQYTCPRCELKTCSLECVKIHKKELNCCGERDKVAYVPLSKFTNLNLLSDYRFLEDATRAIDNCRRNPLKKYSRFSRPLPPHLYKLKKEAQRRRTTLLYLPQHFTRHKENTTILHFESKKIYWKLELIFPQGDNIKIVMEKCDENERLSSILSKFTDFDSCPALYRKNLRFYHSTGLSGVEVLLFVENTKIKPSFFILDKFSTIRENLEDIVIIEFPILYVILKSHKDEYTILDPDMKVDCDTSDEFKKERNFLNFIPFSYFDTMTYSKKPLKGNELAKSISQSAKELRKYFGTYESDDEKKENGKKEKVVSHKKRFFHKKKLNIPTYEKLISQNS